MTMTAGFDVGGAHLKVARVANGRVAAVAQIACELWKGIERLDIALEEARRLVPDATRVAITMTGELCEIFPSRRDGVIALTSHLESRLGSQALFYRGLKGFGTATAAKSDWSSVASANFLATASAVARHQSKALLIDMGSTTTDIIACDRPQGLTDAERLQTGELVYTGLTRTPVPSVATRAIFAGQWQDLARDTFATMADVRRVLDELPDGLDTHTTADARGKSLQESLTRLARGFGRDAELRHLAAWKVAARHIADTQRNSIVEGALQVLSRPGIEVTRVVTAGIGAHEAANIAARLGLPAITFGELVNADETCRRHATHYAPAVAVALLASEQ
jgi:probable H4MPT-linked C1 transfer pathway protein